MLAVRRFPCKAVDCRARPLAVDSCSPWFDPGAPIEGNGYAQTGVRTLPGSWREALDLAARSEFLEETLGKDFLRIFLAIKNQECARFSAEVSELDYAWYLRS